MLMAISMMGNGQRTKQMEREFIYMLMVLDMKDKYIIIVKTIVSGRTISSMVLALKPGLIMPDMKETTWKGRNMGKGS